jgi:hypothetical protein
VGVLVAVDFDIGIETVGVTVRAKLRLPSVMSIVARAVAVITSPA